MYLFEELTGAVFRVREVFESFEVENDGEGFRAEVNVGECTRGLFALSEIDSRVSVSTKFRSRAIQRDAVIPNKDRQAIAAVNFRKDSPDCRAMDWTPSPGV
jgi:hypothetical protein